MLSRPFHFSLVLLVLVGLSVAGCGRRTPAGRGVGYQDVYNVDYQIGRLDSKVPAERISAMLWLQKCNKSEAQKALPKLQQLAKQDKNEGVRKEAEKTIAKIQGG
jgi:hypothetical protein